MDDAGFQCVGQGLLNKGVAGLVEKSSPPIAGSDLSFLASLPLLALTSWLTGEAAWHGIARRAGGFSGGRKAEAIAARIAEVAGNRPLPQAPAEIYRELVANSIEIAFQIMRDHLPPRWRPSIEIVGEEHLQAALSRGKGVVLWTSHFYFASLATKVGLHRAGYGLHHLSRPEHGFSSTRFGKKFLNPIRSSMESRYLAERLVIQDDDPKAVLAALTERLRQNAIVSITVRGSARRPVRVRFLDDWLTVAPGAPVLASKTDAALIPVFTIRPQIGRYRIVLGEPIELAGDRPREEAVEQATADYAQRLERFVIEYPGQWIEWRNI